MNSVRVKNAIIISSGFGEVGQTVGISAATGLMDTVTHVVNLEAYIGRLLDDPSIPLEVLRVLHSFDPCLACAVHIIDIKGKDLGEYKINAACSI